MPGESEYSSGLEPAALSEQQSHCYLCQPLVRAPHRPSRRYRGGIEQVQ